MRVATNPRAEVTEPEEAVKTAQMAAQMLENIKVKRRRRQIGKPWRLPVGPYPAPRERDLGPKNTPRAVFRYSRCQSGLLL